MSFADKLNKLSQENMGYFSISDRLSIRQQEEIEGWLFAVPKILLLIVVMGMPLIYGFYISLTHSTIYELPGEFIGLENYIWALQNDVLYRSILNVSIMAAVLVPVNIGLGFITALFLTEKLKMTHLYRLAFIVPVAGPAIIWATVWKWMYNPNAGGIINYILLQTNIIDSPLSFTSDPQLALPSVITPLLFWYGFNMLIYIAAMSGVPDSLVESAKLDGAGRWARIRYLIWPLMKPVTFFLFVIQVINALRYGFNVVFVMTQGGPVNASMVPSFLIYQLAFDFQSFGKAAAVSFIMFAITLLITGLMYKPLQGRAEYYE